jgi:hypothetical protein
MIAAGGAEMDVLARMGKLLHTTGEPELILELRPKLMLDGGVDPVEPFNRLASWQFDVYCIDEKGGPLPEKAIDVSSLVERLLANGSSVNPFCSKP